MKYSNFRVIVLILLLSFASCPNADAFQASCYGRNYGDTVDTTTSATNAAGFLGDPALGYSSQSFTSDSAVVALNRMSNDNIFFFNGHGTAGAIEFQSPSDIITAKPIPGLPSLADTSGELDGILLAVFEGCHTANSYNDGNNDWGNLLDESNKAGIDNAVGFQDNIYPPESNFWSDKFWLHLKDSYNIPTAASMASDETYHHSFGIISYGYHGTNSWQLNTIAGANHIIYPAQAGQLTPSSYPTFTETQTPNSGSPVASFTCTLVGNNQIQFSDTSTNSPTSFTWGFGDGSSPSLDPNPIHDYGSGPHTSMAVFHAVKNNVGGDDITQKVVVGNNPCQSVASYTKIQIGNSLTYWFNDTSSYSPDHWIWDFSDGGYSNEQNAKHTFPEQGTYTINLSVAKNGVTSRITTQEYINGLSDPNPSNNLPLAARYSVSVTEGSYPLKVKFTDQSDGSPNSWNWNFQDGYSSSEQNPVHTFDQGHAGFYSPVLTVRKDNSNPSSYNQQTIYVYQQNPTAAVQISTQSPTKNVPVHFTSSNSGAAGIVEWDFGDMSSKSNDPIVDHTYSSIGSYTARLTVTNSYGNATSTTSINVTEAPLIASFTPDVTSGIAPLTVHFTDMSSGNPTSWNWKFRNTWFNTTEESQKNATYQFTGTGIYNVTLYVTGASGTNSTTQDITVTDKTPPMNTDPVEFTVPGSKSFTVPVGVDIINVTIVGGGGGGGGGNVNVVGGTEYYRGGYGGSAGSIINDFIPVSGGNVLSVTVGSGKPGGYGRSNQQSGYPGLRGEDSKVGGKIAYGGSGGNGAEPASSTSDPNGRDGVNGFGIIQLATSGYRAGPPSGEGGVGGIGWGAGGGGASGSYGEPTLGGNGADGYVRIAPYVPFKPVANFSANKTTGSYPFAVNFTDRSTNKPLSWNWSFGDGNFSTLQNPVYTYVKNGKYMVNLTVTNRTINITSKKDFITVLIPTPIVAFSANITNSTCPVAVQFNDLSEGEITNWSWNFGDKSSGFGPNPVHIYTNDGIYGVTLNVSNNKSKVNISSQKFLIDAYAPIPVANFAANITMGKAPLTVQFTNTTAGNQTKWSWSFGDGQISSLASPVNKYTKPGNYTVNFTVSNRAGSNTTIRTEYIYVYPMPIVSFTATPVSGNAILNVQFTDTSTGGPLAWNWSFGDGTFSEAKNPFKSYSTLGKYTVNLTVTNVTSNTTSKLNYINVSTVLPFPNFTVNSTRGTLPLTVQFTDVSTGNVTGWNWSFGDGKLSTVKNPVYTYTKDGNYTVSLNVTNGRSNITIRSKYVDVLPPLPVANFTASPLTGKYPLTVQFINTSTGNQTKWNWSFGDGNVSALANPTNKYSKPGNYTVILNVSNRAGSDVMTRTEYIIVLPSAPVANFTTNVTIGTVPLAVMFNDTSANKPSDWNWSFGDGNFSTQQNVTYIYPFTGTFNVRLTAGNAGGSNVSVRKTNITVNLIPIGDFTVDRTNGPAPLAVSFTDRSIYNPSGWSWYFGDENWAGTGWTRMNSSAAWTARYIHSSVSMPDGSIILMGGYDTTGRNDVWRSFDNGITWTRQTAAAGWPATYFPIGHLMPDGSIVVIAVKDGSSSQASVWRSTDYGVTWTRQTATAGWSARGQISSAVMPDGSIIVSGGTQSGGFTQFNDVWRSTDYGVTWTQQTGSAAWPQRYGHTSVALPDGSIVIMGGYTYQYGYRNDVWRSTDNGVSWVPVNASAGWQPRHQHHSVTMPDSSILLMGGMYSDAYLNDVWRSADKGETWTPVMNAEWSGRRMSSNVVMPDGSTLILGGYTSAGPVNDIWRFMPAGSSAQNPIHTFTSPGTYSVSLSARNSTGFTTITKQNFITVSPSGMLMAMRSAEPAATLSEADQNAKYFRLWNIEQSRKGPVIDRNATMSTPEGSERS
jgi:PKD repeat protein